MAEPSAKAMAGLFTDLIGRRVNFSQRLDASPSSDQQIYCVYVVKPMESIRVIQADALLLASFAGALIGLSAEAIKERMEDASVDEALNDALREVMNIASRIVSLEHRAVFKSLHSDSSLLPLDARNTLRDPCYTSHFDVTIDGYTGGMFSLLAPV
ncbi:MAG: hypothetical protein WBY53_08960 [Acidobacteriaceae bacterium]